MKTTVGTTIKRRMAAIVLAGGLTVGGVAFVIANAGNAAIAASAVGGTSTIATATAPAGTMAAPPADTARAT